MRGAMAAGLVNSTLRGLDPCHDIDTRVFWPLSYSSPPFSRDKSLTSSFSHSVVFGLGRGPDVDPVWEQISSKSIRTDTAKHDRLLVL